MAFKWPYTYDSCNVGTAPNQTRNGLPYVATINGDASYDDALSVLPGQKLSRCTCPGEDHPGPMHPDGTYVGRAAPEIDMFEAQVHPSFISKCIVSNYGRTPIGHRSSSEGASISVCTMGGTI